MFDSTGGIKPSTTADFNSKKRREDSRQQEGGEEDPSLKKESGRPETGTKLQHRTAKRRKKSKRLDKKKQKKLAERKARGNSDHLEPDI